MTQAAEGGLNMSTWFNRGGLRRPLRGAEEKRPNSRTAEQPIHPTASHTEILTPPQNPILRPLLEALMLQQSVHNAMRRPA
jgi:hypothetical protein